MVSILVAAAWGGLGFGQPLVVAIGVATLFVAQDAAAFGALPLIVGRPRIGGATSLLVATSTVVGLAGPALGGVLVATAGAPLVLGLDGLAYLLSATLDVVRPVVDPPVEPIVGLPWWRRLSRDIGEGVGYLWSQPAIRALTLLGIDLRHRRLGDLGCWW